MNNTKSFRDIFDDMIFGSLERIDIKLFKTKELCNVNDEVEDIYKMIENFLPSEHKKLIEKYEEERICQQALTNRIIYEQGLKDGTKLMNILNS